jgi:cell division protein FtsL
MEIENVEKPQVDVESSSNLKSEKRSRKMQKMWIERTFMEKVLLITCVISCLITIGLVISLVSSTSKNEKVENSASSNENHANILSDSSDICTSKTCVQESARVLTWLKNETDP